MKKMLFVAALTIIGGLSMAEAEKARSLTDKRFIQDLEKDTVPYHKAQLSKKTGNDVEVEVKWDTFDSEALKYVKSMGFQAVEEATTAIGRDAVGKEHLKQNLKKVILINHDKVEDRKNVLKDGVLEVHGAWGKSHKGYPDMKDIKAVIENAN